MHKIANDKPVPLGDQLCYAIYSAGDPTLLQDIAR